MSTPQPPASRLVGITAGDPAGIGPEIVMRALDRRRDETHWNYLVLGDGVWLNATAARLGLDLRLEAWNPSHPGSRFSFLNPGESFDARPPSPGDPRAARSALACLDQGARLCLSGTLAALVTGPVSKEHIARLGIPFVGQTEYLSALSGEPRTVMMLLGHDEQQRWLRVALATVHLPLRAVAQELSTDKILLAIQRASEACHRLGLPRQRVAVCGLNPHAGEGGTMGDEEQRVIRPAVESARARGWDAHGPFAADTLFRQVFFGQYEAVVAMYHDQGLVPLKMVAFDSGVNWTLGLPWIRTSPDHGTAFDIAGKGIARPDSMLAALSMAEQLAVRAADVKTGCNLPAQLENRP